MTRHRAWFLVAMAAMGTPALAEETLHLHEFQRRKLTDTFYCEGASAGDLNGDGKVDVVSGPFWYEGPDFSRKHAIYPPKPFKPKGYSDNFFSFTGDIDRDGRVDVVVVSFPGKETWWFRNPGRDGWEKPWARHLALKTTDNESPIFTDIDGDGVAEMVCSSNGYFGYARPDPAKPREPWSWHVISEKIAGGRFAHGLGVGDVNGDGREDVLFARGWLEQPTSTSAKAPWKFHQVRFGSGGAQMFAYDVDGDGDNDVITSLQAHAYGLAWFEQVASEGAEPVFKQHLVIGQKPEDSPYGLVISQMHALALVDMDGDGIRDVVTGKRWWAHNGNDPGAAMPAVLYWFRTVRGRAGVSFVPHRIDEDSGVGTQVTVADVTGNGLSDVVVGNKKGTFVHLHTRRKVSRGEWEAAQPRPTTTKETQ